MYRILWLFQTNVMFPYLPLLVFLGTTPSVVAAQGVQFTGGHDPIENRTSIELFTDKTPVFQERLDIRFDLQLPSNGTAGYIVRLKGRNQDPTFNLYYDQEDDEAIFRFNEEGKSSLITVRAKWDALLDQHWVPVRISFDLKQGLIQLQIGEIPTQVTKIELKHRYAPEITFGKSEYLIDVPAMALRRLRISDVHQSFDFPLRETKGEKLHTAAGKVMGRVQNGIWLLNQAFYWQSHGTMQLSKHAGSTYDPKTRSVYYFSSDSLQVYHVQNGQRQSFPFSSPCPLPLNLAETFINPDDNRLYVYETSYDSLYTGPTVASLDLTDYSWRVESSDYLGRELHHHGSVVSPATNKLLIFGGFGEMRYSNNLIEYAIGDGQWSRPMRVKGDTILPRYFTSMGYASSDQQVYLFGGMGNESGEHIVGRKYFYDLYKIDPRTGQSEKLWHLDWEDPAFVPARGLVIADSAWIYLLGYPEHLTHSHIQLKRFSIADGEYQRLGDSIPIYSDRIRTRASLFFDQRLKKLIAVLQESDDDIRSSVSIYSLDFPAIPKQDLYAFPQRSSTNNWWFFVLITSAVALIVAFYWISPRSRRRGKRRLSTPISQPLEELAPPPALKNKIYLFGDFTVIDKHGRDISHLFSARLKQVFCLILFHSDAAGISSRLLSHLLWPEKPRDKVKTSRGVAISNLRKVLNEIEGVEIHYQEGHYRLIVEAPCSCDYWNIKRNCLYSAAFSEQCQQAVERGEFLLGLDDPLFDTMKAETERALTTSLLQSIQESRQQNNWQRVTQLSDLLLRIDRVNVQAVQFGVEGFAQTEQQAAGALFYQRFAEYYEQLMGEPYTQSFDDIWRQFR